ncbi:tryptophan ABC transporter substrate-binding protein [Lacticaseibacillus mingshuiensis]|uniref:tryptophan ABC transporter substrate-binding protein n=1 Tax=Lacticaseibacillus mingshuiensis TaxID=2799574 RepID=UPI001950EDAA|nr:tryptophan ABC transporter substrate-binding protein [Lacticaseibacillus mingshuiensis]
MKRMIALIAVLVVFLGVAFGVESKPEQAAKTSSVKTVGILQLMSHPALDAIHKGIIQGLKNKGYTVGKNLKIDFQNAENDQSNLKTMSQRFASEKADAMIGIATPSAQALANVTSTTPIILGAITDPKGAKLVNNNTKPGGNITGVFDQAPVKAQLKLIRQLMPDAKTLGVISTSSDDSAQTQARLVTKEAPNEGFTVKNYTISSTNDLAQVGGQMVNQVDAVFVPTDNTIASAMQTLVKVANVKKVPVFPTVDTMVKDGGVATIGINQFHLGVVTGEMTADVLSGKSKPATTPIHFETTGELILNTKQAKLLGIKLPASLLKEAKKNGEVIK